MQSAWGERERERGKKGGLRLIDLNQLTVGEVSWRKAIDAVRCAGVLTPPETVAVVERLLLRQVLFTPIDSTVE